MPLVRIDLVEGKPDEYACEIGDVVYDAMIEVLNVPKDDRFQVIAEHPESSLISDENYIGVKRTPEIGMSRRRAAHVAQRQPRVGRTLRIGARSNSVGRS